MTYDFDDMAPIFPKLTEEEIDRYEKEILAWPRDVQRECPMLYRSAYFNQLTKKAEQGKRQ